MARTGKIACLPLEIRNELNRRLDDGESGRDLLPWLNDLPEVREMLARKFAGQPINKQNLGAWRAGGHRAWQARNEILSEARREMRSEARGLASDAGKLAGAAKGRLTDHLATVLAARYASVLLHWTGEVTEEFKGHVRVLGELCRDVGILRRGDHGGERMEMERARQGDDSGWKVEDGGSKNEDRKLRMDPPSSQKAGLRRARERGRSSLVKAGQGWSSQTFFSQGDQHDRKNEHF
jgi:hypothetical protein